MNEDQLAQLELEAAIGRRAKSAYDGYLKEYVEIQNKELYERFISDSVSTQEAINIKISQSAFNALERGILSDIETGKLAEIQLGK